MILKYLLYEHNNPQYVGHLPYIANLAQNIIIDNE